MAWKPPSAMPNKPRRRPCCRRCWALLQAVLGHADGRLGDAGAALRQDFLQRHGLLSARPGAWVLQVERRPGDELLDGLPWSWSWIRLPWMDDLLQVVW